MPDVLEPFILDKSTFRLWISGAAGDFQKTLCFLRDSAVALIALNQFLCSLNSSAQTGWILITLFISNNALTRF